MKIKHIINFPFVYFILVACTATPLAKTLPDTVTPTRLASPMLSPTLASTNTPVTVAPSVIPSLTPFEVLASPYPTVSLVPSETPDAIPEPMEIRMFDEKNGWLKVSYAVGAGHVFHTQNGGKTWEDVSPETSSLFLSTAFLDAQTAWELASPPRTSTGDQPGTLYRTDDGGKTWISTTVPFSDQVYLSMINVKNGWAEKVVACGAGTCMARLYQTSDGGRTWSLMSLGDPNGGSEKLPPGTIHFIDGYGFSFQNFTTLWFAGNGCCSYPYADLFVSRDSGGAWQQEQLPLSGRNPNSGPDFVSLPVFFTEKDGLIAVSFEGMHPEVTDPFQDYDMITFITHDGGLTWLRNPPVLSGNVNLFQVHFVSLKDAYVICDQGQSLCTTHDGYKTWKRIQSNLVFKPNDHRPLVDFEFISANLGWAIVGTPEHNLIYKTTDGGVTWNIMP